MNIYQRVNKVMQAVEYVQKDASVSTGGGSYRAVTHDMVLAVLRKAMVEHGIVTVPRLLGHEMLHLRGANPKENGQYSQHLYQATFAVRFVNIENPDDFIEATVQAHANDSGDKAPGKAMSYAVKYAMLKVFGLETGENEEGRFSDRPMFTEEQREKYHILLESENAVEFLCMEKEVGPEVWSALHNSFPDGKKSNGKRAAAALTAAGWDEIALTANKLKDYINANDTAGILETVEAMGPTERRLVGNRLNEHEIDTIRSVKELAA